MPPSTSFPSGPLQLPSGSSPRQPHARPHAASGDTCTFQTGEGVPHPDYCYRLVELSVYLLRVSPVLSAAGSARGCHQEAAAHPPHVPPSRLELQRLIAVTSRVVNTGLSADLLKAQTGLSSFHHTLHQRFALTGVVANVGTPSLPTACSRDPIVPLPVFFPLSWSLSSACVARVVFGGLELEGKLRMQYVA
jgi:hypothetical protein